LAWTHERNEAANDADTDRAKPKPGPGEEETAQVQQDHGPVARRQQRYLQMTLADPTKGPNQRKRKKRKQGEKQNRKYPGERDGPGILRGRPLCKLSRDNSVEVLCGEKRSPHARRESNPFRLPLRPARQGTRLARHRVIPRLVHTVPF
jgi:hypothetical protein